MIGPLDARGRPLRAALNAVRGEESLRAHDPGGIEVLEAGPERFRDVLLSERHTVKRALTDPRLFSGIAWGGSEVYDTTARRLDALGYRWRALPRLWDVDRPEDLERLRWLRYAAAVRRGARR